MSEKPKPDELAHDARDPSLDADDGLDAPPTDDELRLAEELRAALESADGANAITEGAGSDPGPDASLARAMAAAWSPRDLDPAAHRALVEQAFAHSDEARRRRRVVRVSFGASTVLALAACVALVVGMNEARSGRGGSSAGAMAAIAAPASPMAVSRSTQVLFPDRFAPEGGYSSRIDRIAASRLHDLRDNELALRGAGDEPGGAP